MAFNLFKIRKYAALILNSFISVILFVIGNMYYGFVGGVGFMFGGLLVGIVLGLLLLKNPFSDMLEGKGIMVLNIDSTGIIRPFIVAVASPYIRGWFNKRPIEDVFDRATVSHLTTPEKNSNNAIVNKNGGITIELDEKTYNDGRFALFHFPVLIWNDQIKSIITKDFLSEKEKDAFSEHGVLYLNRKVEELTATMRDFGRYVVETLKPTTSIFQSKWFWIIIVIVGVILLGLFAPIIYKTMVGFVGGAGNSISSSAVVTPR